MVFIFFIAEITSEPLVHDRRKEQRQRKDGGATIAGPFKTPVSARTKLQKALGKTFVFEAVAGMSTFVTGRVIGVRHI